MHHKRKNQARTIFHTQKSHGPIKIRGRTRTHAVSSFTNQGPSHPAPILPHLSSSNRRLYHRRVWNPLRKLYRSRNSLPPRTPFQKKQSIFRFFRNKTRNQRTHNTPIYTTEQIAAEIRREFNRGRSLSRSPSASSSLQQTVYSESFDLQRQLSRSPSPLSQYEQTTQMALHQCSPIVYSDLYFKHGVSLNARIFENGSLTQSINGILYQRNRLRYNRRYRDHMLNFDSIEQLNFRTNYMPLYLSDDIKPKNFRALLIDCHVVTIDRIIINNQDFKNKCYEKQIRNEQSFQSYNAMIRLESGETFEEYFFEKFLEECYSRVRGCGLNRLARYYYRHKSLERMHSRCNSTLSMQAPTLRRSPSLKRSPLSLRRKSSSLPLSQSMLNLLHIDKYNLVNKSPDAIEKMLQRRQEIIQQIRSGNYSYDLSKLDLDKSLENFPNDPMMLEPLLATMHEIKQQDHYGRKARFNRVKQQTITHFIIGYTLALFLLTILTFFILFFI